MRNGLLLALLLGVLLATPRAAGQSAGETAPAVTAAPDATRLFIESCASCHGPDRMGLLAPPLMQQTLTRFSDEQIRDLLRKGIPGTRMPSFTLTLDDAKIAELIRFIRRPGTISWSDADVAASRKVHEPDGPPQPVGDTEDLTAVVERGTGNVLFIQDHELIREVFFPNVHGGLKYVGDKLFVPARTGFVMRLDLPTVRPELTVRAGIYLRNIEVSPEHVIAACSLPPSLVFFDHDLTWKKTILLDADPSAVTRLDERRFLVTFNDRPKLLLVEGDQVTREIPVSAPYKQCARVGDLVIGTNGKTIFATDFVSEAKLEDSAIPHIAAGEFWEQDGVTMWATPKIDTHGITVYRVRRGGGSDEPARIDKVAQIEATALPVRGHTNTFVRTHPALDFLVTTSGSDVLIVSKQDFTVRRTLTPMKGKMALHTEFSQDGSTLFVSVYDERGGIFMFDTRDFSLRGMIPAAKPAGQYNRFMKSWRN